MIMVLAMMVGFIVFQIIQSDLSSPYSNPRDVTQIAWKAGVLSFFISYGVFRLIARFINSRTGEETSAASSSAEGQELHRRVSEVSARLVDQTGLPWMQESVKVSPDNKRLAYAVGRAEQQMVVVDGQVSPPYDGIAENSLRFSPDSKRLVYGTRKGKQWMVVDGQAGELYDSIVTLGGGRIIFDSPYHLHYFATKRDNVYLVEERLIENSSSQAEGTYSE
jgi:hypothetical protein